MKSNNPVFNRSPEFSGQSTNAYGNQTYPANGAPYGGYGQQQGYSDPSTWGTGTPGTPAQVDQGRMTIDSVVQKSAISLLFVVAAAGLTWFMTPEITSTASLGPLYLALTVGSLGAFGLSILLSFKSVISPALVLVFCALEGVALGALSKVFDAQFGDSIVTQAVLGTFAAFAGTLAAYKFFNIKVGNKFNRFVNAAVIGMIGLALLEGVLLMFGNSIGISGFGGIGLLFAVAGLVLGVLMLIADFDFVERGVAAGLPERESWRAAFALTVSLVWIYTNLLKILAIFSSD